MYNLVVYQIFGLLEITMDINNFEYAVMQKNIGKLKKRKNLLIISYIIFTVVYFTLIFTSKLLPLGAVYPFLMYILVLSTYKYVQIDNKYTIISGSLIFARKYGNSKPKVLAEFKLKTAEIIAPINQCKEQIASFAPKNIFDARSAPDVENAYVALYRDKENAPCAFYFEITEDAHKVFKYYAPNYKPASQTES